MASDERKLATASLIPLEIDPASVLSLSKGVIFDTIVHNIEQTLSNRRTDPLPWKLTGMSLICDANRNKKYMQKLQKMQCVPSAICTEIYHSKLIISESGSMATPGRKIIIPTVPRRRLTGIIVARSLDDLLHMESESTTSAHFIQYKLLSYERIPTREIVHGPRLSSINEKILKTVFDFELTQNNGFPRQLLPVAIVSFSRQESSDLCLSIRNFLLLDEHKIFDKSYLVTSTNMDLIRLREEQERREDEEAEAEAALNKAQRRQPFADLSKKTPETVNARPSPITPRSENVPRVPPLKLKLPPSKPTKPPVVSAPLETKFECNLNLDRIDLSMFDISNLKDVMEEYEKKKTESTHRTPLVLKIKDKALSISKPYEHQKTLKRLNNLEPKRLSTLSPAPSTETSFKGPSRANSCSTRSVSIDTTITLTSENSSTSASIGSLEIKLSKSKTRKEKERKTIVKKKVVRPPLPPEYQCSIAVSRLDLSLYNIDLPVLNKSPSNASNEVPSVIPEANAPKATEPTPATERNSEATASPEDMLPIIDHSLMQSIDLPSSMVIDEFVANDPDPMNISPMDDLPPTLVTQILSEARNENPSENKDGSSAAKSVESTIGSAPVTNIVDATDVLYVAQSPDLPPLDDDPVLFAIDHPEHATAEPPMLPPEDCMIIVECSDDDLDYEDESVLLPNQNSESKTTDPPTTTTATVSSPLHQSPLPATTNPSGAQPMNPVSLINGHRSSRSSSCSSLSTMFHNQSPKSALQLVKYLLPKSVLNKQHQQRASILPALANRKGTSMPLTPTESLVDPRLIYRLKTITTDLRWPSPCNQCSILPHLPSMFSSSTQTIAFDPKIASNCLDPRRDSLKTALLNHLFHRLTILQPHLFVNHRTDFEKLLFEQTSFKTNCSIHLEYLLHKIQIADDEQLSHLLQKNDEFQLSPSLLKMIFN